MHQQHCAHICIVGEVSVHLHSSAAVVAHSMQCLPDQDIVQGVGTPSNPQDAKKSTNETYHHMLCASLNLHHLEYSLPCMAGSTGQAMPALQSWPVFNALSSEFCCSVVACSQFMMASRPAVQCILGMQKGTRSAHLSHAHNTRGKHPVLFPSIHVFLQLIGTLALCQRHVAAIPPLHLLLHLSLLLGKDSLIAQEGVVGLIHLGSPFFLIIPFPV